MTLENDVEETNIYYLETKEQYSQKPTPIQVVDVSYPSRNKAKIVEAYYRTPSTTDFNGIIKVIILTDCKTKSPTSIPLANIHVHQIEHLKNTRCRWNRLLYLL